MPCGIKYVGKIAAQRKSVSLTPNPTYRSAKPKAKNSSRFHLEAAGVQTAQLTRLTHVRELVRPR